MKPRRKYLSGYLVDDWREQVEEGKAAPYEPFRKELPNVYRDMREMREGGVSFLAGTDAGVVFMYPGFSLHNELERLVEDPGFTAMEALKIATDGVAGFYDERDSNGALAPGQMAELLLLDADPLADIHNTTRIVRVMTHWRWFGRGDLDNLLRGVARSVKNGCDPEGLSHPQQTAAMLPAVV